jgi:threonine-phosphate decarboxylase
MPGIRLGYALCSDTEFLQKIKQAGQPWNVSILAENAGVAALNDQAYVKNSKNIIARERVYLSEALKKMDIKVYPSKANYILFRLNKVFPLKERLFDKNILIRSCANYRGLDARYYRIAVKNHEDNIMLIEAIKNILF